MVVYLSPLGGDCTKHVDALLLNETMGSVAVLLDGELGNASPLKIVEFGDSRFCFFCFLNLIDWDVNAARRAAG